MTRQIEISDEDLHSFIDGELDRKACATIEAAVSSDLALAATVAGYRADMARIAAVYGSGLDAPLPQQWIAMIKDSTRRNHWRSIGAPALAVAATVILVFGLTVAFRQSAVPARSDIVVDALAARANEVGPRSVISVHSIAEAQAQNAAMARTLDTRVKAPDLSRMGYRLVGIEAYDSPSRSFELIYRDRNARVFTLYLRRSMGAPLFDQFVENGLRICVWQDDVVGTVMAGKMSAAEMQRLASLAYVGLTL